MAARTVPAPPGSPATGRAVPDISAPIEAGPPEGVLGYAEWVVDWATLVGAPTALLPASKQIIGGVPLQTDAVTGTAAASVVPGVGLRYTVPRPGTSALNQFVTTFWQSELCAALGIPSFGAQLPMVVVHVWDQATGPALVRDTIQSLFWGGHAADGVYGPVPNPHNFEWDVSSRGGTQPGIFTAYVGSTPFGYAVPPGATLAIRQTMSNSLVAAPDPGGQSASDFADWVDAATGTGFRFSDAGGGRLPETTNGSEAIVGDCRSQHNVLTVSSTNGPDWEPVLLESRFYFPAVV